MQLHLTDNHFNTNPYWHERIKSVFACPPKEAVELFDTNTNGYPDSVKQNHKKFMQGNIIEFENREPDLKRMKQFKIYLDELDRRRNTSWMDVYPQIYKELKDL